MSASGPADQPRGYRDEQFMWRVKLEGDPQAFAALMERWQLPIQRLCVRMTGDLHRAEDLAQEVFVRLFARRSQYESTGRFSTFLWRIALNLCYDELRRIKRRREESLEESGHDEARITDYELRITPHDAAGENERAEIVRQALLQLSEPHRVVVVLRHYEGLKFREIAELLDIPEGTVKSRMAEALSQLHNLLTPTLQEGDELCPTIKLKAKPVLAI